MAFCLFSIQIINEKYSKRPLDANERQRIISTIQDDNQGHYTKYNQLAYELENLSTINGYISIRHVNVAVGPMMNINSY